MLVPGLVAVVTGGLLLTWCSVGLALANPGRRLPGRLPAVVHPAGYMPVGTLGLVLVVTGAIVVTVSVDVSAWVLAGAVVGVSLGGPMLHHNRRLPL